MIAFAVVGRNEARYLPESLRQAFEAAGPDDRVVFVDSESSDGSATVAADLGAEVIPAPEGKGRAMSTALDLFPDDHVCFIDGDIERSERNIPLTLAEGLRASGADMVIAQFEWPEKRFVVNQSAIYDPLVGALFPEAVGRFGRFAFSGFRLVRSAAVIRPMPLGFGAELHMNVSFAVAGRSVEVVHVGRYGGPVRDKITHSHELADAVLDYAERIGRLDSQLRPEWDAWVESVAELIRAWTNPESDEDVAQFHEHVLARAAAPLPPAVQVSGANATPNLRIAPDG